MGTPSRVAGLETGRGASHRLSVPGAAMSAVSETDASVGFAAQAAALDPMNHDIPCIRIVLAQTNSRLRQWLAASACCLAREKVGVPGASQEAKRQVKSR